jgi:hypothetical protein
MISVSPVRTLRGGALEVESLLCQQYSPVLLLLINVPGALSKIFRPTSFRTDVDHAYGAFCFLLMKPIIKREIKT